MKDMPEWDVQVLCYTCPICLAGYTTLEEKQACLTEQHGYEMLSITYLPDGEAVP